MINREKNLLQYDLSAALANNLNTLISSSNISQGELAKLANIPYSTVNAIAVGSSANPRLLTLQKLANVFKLSISQLIGESPLDKITSIPVLPWNQICCEKGKIDITTSLETKFIIVDKEVDHESFFALYVEVDNYPEYKKGSILIFENTIGFKENDIILISHQKTKPVLKTILIEGTETYLKSVSNDIPAQVYDPTNTVIFGVLREVRISKF